MADWGLLSGTSDINRSLRRRQHVLQVLFQVTCGVGEVKSGVGFGVEREMRDRSTGKRLGRNVVWSAHVLAGKLTPHVFRNSTWAGLGPDILCLDLKKGSVCFE